MQERRLNGQAAKAIRVALGLPGSEFAIKCGMSAGQLSNIEGGVKPASHDAARRICAQLEAAWPDPSHHRSKPVDLWVAITYPTALEATG
jgi:transcriptional regulator with XRE-family HTH domain